MKTSKTFKTVQQQLEAMGAALFEVGVRLADGRMLLREWAPDAVLKAVPWLQHENASGADIYVRPSRSRGSALVLLDDLSRERIASLPDVGLTPCVVVETSKDNFQAWVRLSPDAQPPAVRTAVARQLATTLGGDLRSADYAHLGRLAGFTNRKKCRLVNGKPPFARLIVADRQQVAEQGNTLVREALQRIKQRSTSEPELVTAKAPRAPIPATVTGTQPPSAAGEKPPINGACEPYRRHLRDLEQRYGAALDASRADWMCALYLFSTGLGFGQIAHAMEQHSPGLAARKGNIGDYLLRTVGKAEVWHELRAQGHAFDQVREDLLPRARQRAAERGVTKLA